MVSPLKVSSGQFPFHCSLGVSTRKARLAGVLLPPVGIVAYKVNAKIDIRLVPPLTADMMLEKVENHLHKHGYDDVKISVRQRTPWSKSDPESLASRAALKALDNSGIDKGYVWPMFPGTGPAYLFTQTCGIPFVSYGLGQGGRIHAPNEYHTVRGLRDNEKSCVAYLYFLSELSQQ